MDSILDRYNWQARVFPVYITIAPAILALAAILPQGLDLSLSAASVVFFVPIAFLSAQVGADFGKRLEKRLWLKWDASPTTRFLRHSNTEFNAVSRERLHMKLSDFGLKVPSVAYQQCNQQAADVYWEACTEYLINRTRDRKRFPLVFKALTEYGFRRNLLALKPFGILLSIVAVLICLWKTWDRWDGDEPIAVAVYASVLSSSLLIVWLVWVRQNTVAISAKRYARFLLEAAQELE